MAKRTMRNGGKHYGEIAARVNPSPIEMPDGPRCLSAEQQSTSLRDLRVSVFPIGFSLRDKLLLECSRSGEKSKFKLGLNTIRRI